MVGREMPFLSYWQYQFIPHSIKLSTSINNVDTVHYHVSVNRWELVDLQPLESVGWNYVSIPKI